MKLPTFGLWLSSEIHQRLTGKFPYSGKVRVADNPEWGIGPMLIAVKLSPFDARQDYIARHEGTGRF